MVNAPPHRLTNSSPFHPNSNTSNPPLNIFERFIAIRQQRLHQLVSASATSGNRSMEGDQGNSSSNQPQPPPLPSSSSSPSTPRRQGVAHDRLEWLLSEPPSVSGAPTTDIPSDDSGLYAEMIRRATVLARAERGAIPASGIVSATGAPIPSELTTSAGPRVHLPSASSPGTGRLPINLRTDPLHLLGDTPLVFRSANPRVSSGDLSHARLSSSPSLLSQSRPSRHTSPRAVSRSSDPPGPQATTPPSASLLSSSAPASSRGNRTHSHSTSHSSFPVPGYLTHSIYHRYRPGSNSQSFSISPPQQPPYPTYSQSPPSFSSAAPSFLPPVEESPFTLPLPLPSPSPGAPSNSPAHAPTGSGTIPPVPVFSSKSYEPPSTSAYDSSGWSSAGVFSSLSPPVENARLPGTSVMSQLPTRWDEEDCCQLVRVDRDGRGAVFTGTGNRTNLEAAAVRANRPIPHHVGVFYYEAKVVNRGESGYIGIGFSALSCPLSRLPGWESDSYGYHGDDGLRFESSGTGQPFGPTFTTGDVIGCGVDWTFRYEEGKGGRTGPATARKPPSNTTGEGGYGKAFFTKNGTFIGYAFHNLKGQLYPSVGMRTAGEAVKANFGQEPFQFDIERYVIERKQHLLHEIETHAISPSLLIPASTESSDVPDPVTNTVEVLIQSYLAHHGYTSTARAFRLQREARARSLAVGMTAPADHDPTFVDAVEEQTGEGVGDHDPDEFDGLMRGEITKYVLNGDIDSALEAVQRHYPSALVNDQTYDGDDDIMFALRLRKFIEMVMKGNGGGPTNSDDGQNVQEDSELEYKNSRNPDRKDSVGKDVGTTNANTPWPQPSRPSTYGKLSARQRQKQRAPSPPSSPSSNDIDDAFAYGQELGSAYAHDNRPYVQNWLKQAWSLLAYPDLSTVGGELSPLLSPEARRELADQLNTALLASNGRPTRPVLETVYRQAAAVVIEGATYGGTATVADSLAPGTPSVPREL